VSLIAVLAGAAISAGLMFYACRRNNSRILVVLFTIWVIAPFAALVLAQVNSKRWPVPIRVVFDRLMLALTLGSLAVYGANALSPLSTKGAFVFVVVPAASWVLIAVVASAAALKFRQSSK